MVYPSFDKGGELMPISKWEYVHVWLYINARDVGSRIYVRMHMG